jgi:SNF2 family DNA or RNA helicase
MDSFEFIFIMGTPNSRNWATFYNTTLSLRRIQRLWLDIVNSSQNILTAASNKVPKKRNMTDDEKAYWEDWLEDHKGVMFQIEWYRIILDEAQYL